METKPVYVFARWQVREGYTATVLELLEDAARESRKEDGNLFYRIHQSVASPEVLVLSEAYVSEALWKRIAALLISVISSSGRSFPCWSAVKLS